MGDLARVWAGGDTFQAELLRGRLEAEGIPVLRKGEGEGPYRAGSVYLWVRREDEATARSVIDEALSGAFELAEDADVADEIEAAASGNTGGSESPGSATG